MKKFTKIMSLLLALVMLFSLAACQTGTPEETTKPQGGAETTAPAKETEATEATEPALGLLDPYPETVTLSCSRTLDGISGYPEGITNDNTGYVTYILDALNIQCTTAFEAKSGEDYDRQVSLGIASGEIPDVMVIRGNGSGSGLSFLQELVDNDLIMDLTELYETYGSETMKANYASYGEAVLGMATIDGKLWALPYCAGMFYPMVWVRQDWIEALDLKVDEDGDEIITREELVDIAKAFMAADPGKSGAPVGLALSSVSTHGQMDILTDSFGAYTLRYLRNEDGTVSHGSTDPKMKEALAWMAELYEEGILDPQFGVRTWDGVSELLTNGQLGIYTQNWASSVSTVYEMDPNAHFVCYNIDNGEGKVNFPAPLATSDRYVVISKECKNPEAVFKILELINFNWGTLSAAEKEAVAPELVEQVAAGIGSHARPIGTDIMHAQFSYNTQVKPALDYFETGSTDYPNFDPENNSYYKSLVAWNEDPTNMAAADWTRYHTRFEAALHAHTLSANDSYVIEYPVYALTETMQSNPVDLQGMMEEYFVKIIVGELPLDAFDKYVTQRNAQGDADICAELAALYE